jgi:hypothetical protein
MCLTVVVVVFVVVVVVVVVIFISFVGNFHMSATKKAACTVTFPCKYSTSGCSLSLQLTEKGEHEETCQFRSYFCPCPRASCDWQGSLEQVVPHLTMSHEGVTTLQGYKTKHDTFYISHSGISITLTVKTLILLVHSCV